MNNKYRGCPCIRVSAHDCVLSGETLQEDKRSILSFFFISKNNRKICSVIEYEFKPEFLYQITGKNSAALKNTKL
jgi:hypothetical protein